MHNRKLPRLSGFDYSLSRYYFITTCVTGRVHSFGAIENGTMRLSENGIIAHKQWIWLKDQYPYVELISFIVMPDHVHAILHINKNCYKYTVGNGQRKCKEWSRPFPTGNLSQNSFPKNISKNICIYK